MERISKSIVVDVPVRVAYDQWTQFEEFPRFMEGIEEVHQLDEKRVHWRAEIAGREKEWDSEIVDQVPDKCISWRSVAGAPNNGTVEFEPISATQTRVTLRMEYDPKGVLENIADFFGATSSRVEGDLERFKAFIESRGTETGAWRGRIESGDVVESRPNIDSPSGTRAGVRTRRAGASSAQMQARSTSTGQLHGGEPARQPGASDPSAVRSGSDLELETRAGMGDPTTRIPHTPLRSEEVAGPGSMAFHTDEPDFRDHWQRRYASLGGTYDEYYPAYTHGYSARGRYSGRAWSDIENDVRRDWESSRPGTWERFKDAVRAGWERTRDAMS